MLEVRAKLLVHSLMFEVRAKLLVHFLMFEVRAMLLVQTDRFLQQEGLKCGYSIVNFHFLLRLPNLLLRPTRHFSGIPPHHVMHPHPQLRYFKRRLLPFIILLKNKEQATTVRSESV